jgi:hypothetical protein
MLVRLRNAFFCRKGSILFFLIGNRRSWLHLAMFSLSSPFLRAWRYCFFCSSRAMRTLARSFSSPIISSPLVSLYRSRFACRGQCKSEPVPNLLDSYWLLVVVGVFSLALFQTAWNTTWWLMIAYHPKSWPGRQVRACRLCFRVLPKTLLTQCTGILFALVPCGT